MPTSSSTMTSSLRPIARRSPQARSTLRGSSATDHDIGTAQEQRPEARQHVGRRKRRSDEQAPMPAAARASASAMVAQHAPSAPALARRRAISGDLCDFACGRSDTPAFFALAIMVAILRSSTSRSRMSAGVLIWSRRIETPHILILPAHRNALARRRYQRALSFGKMHGDFLAVVELAPGAWYRRRETRCRRWCHAACRCR